MPCIATVACIVQHVGRMLLRELDRRDAQPVSEQEVAASAPEVRGGDAVAQSPARGASRKRVASGPVDGAGAPLAKRHQRDGGRHGSHARRCLFLADSEPRADDDSAAAVCRVVSTLPFQCRVCRRSSAPLWESAGGARAARAAVAQGRALAAVQSVLNHVVQVAVIGILEARDAGAPLREQCVAAAVRVLVAHSCVARPQQIVSCEFFSIATLPRVQQALLLHMLAMLESRDWQVRAWGVQAWQVLCEHYFSAPCTGVFDPYVSTHVKASQMVAPAGGGGSSSAGGGAGGGGGGASSSGIAAVSMLVSPGAASSSLGGGAEGAATAPHWTVGTTFAGSSTGFRTQVHEDSTPPLRMLRVVEHLCRCLKSFAASGSLGTAEAFGFVLVAVSWLESGLLRDRIAMVQDSSSGGSLEAAHEFSVANIPSYNEALSLSFAPAQLLSSVVTFLAKQWCSRSDVATSRSASVAADVVHRTASCMGLSAGSLLHLVRDGVLPRLVRDLLDASKPRALDTFVAYFLQHRESPQAFLDNNLAIIVPVLFTTKGGLRSHLEYLAFLQRHLLAAALAGALHV